jgi:hypothetical protein
VIGAQRPPYSSRIRCSASSIADWAKVGYAELTLDRLRYPVAGQSCRARPSR